jgi:hypothetical protein
MNSTAANIAAGSSWIINRSVAAAPTTLTMRGILKEGRKSGLTQLSMAAAVFRKP